jgi:hypothetical protein
MTYRPASSEDLYEAADRHLSGTAERARLYRLAADAQRREEAERRLVMAMHGGRQKWDAAA